MSDDVPSVLRSLLKLDSPPSRVRTRTSGEWHCKDFTRLLVEYSGDDGKTIPAFLFKPTTARRTGGVVFFHQHNGQFHFGKSEVAGLIGDRLQAFGPALAARGVTVLAPDAELFEDRRNEGAGTTPGQNDWQQHYNGMAYRLVNGDTLMRKYLDDAQRALCVLCDTPGVNAERVGVAGHSLGGTLALYHAATDVRCRFACISGALSSFAARQASGTGIGMIELVPGLAKRLRTHELVGAILPRPLLVVSASADKYSEDAEAVLAAANVGPGTTHIRSGYGHALDEARFTSMLDWLVAQTDVSRA